jgi:hypothetical protein
VTSKTPMSLFDHAVSLFGYDRAHLDELAPKDANRLRQLAVLGYVPVLGAGGGAGLLVWMSERDPFWTLAIALFVALLVLNLLRLHNSGGGPAPHESAAHADRWAPGAGGVFVLGALAVLSAQPYLAWASERAHAVEVEAHRGALLEAHRTSLAQAGGELEGNGAETSLARCGFVALRLRLLWREPEAPLLATTALAVLFLSPLLLGHLTHLEALRRYQHLRWRSSRALVLADESVTQQLVARHLAMFPGPVASHLNVVPSSEVRS